MSKVAIFSLHLHPDLIAEGRAGAGARGFIAKDLPSEEIVGALLRVATGELVTATASVGLAHGTLDWPGRGRGLTQRQSEVVVLAAEGLSNREIAAALFLGTETVKDYLSQAFATPRGAQPGRGDEPHSSV